MQVERLIHFWRLRILADLSIKAVIGHRLEPKSQALPSLKLTLREFPRVSNSHWLPSPITAIMASAGFFGLIFLKCSIYATFYFFRAKMARENFIQRTHFDTAEKQQFFYKCTPCSVGDPFTNGSCIRISNRCSSNLLNNFYIIQSLEIQAIIF